uniref:Uncharacterized protein n=1 Tax=Romanomermis culicivorax TaxID=13658 RepID=A0A915ICU0_ROMCU
MFEPPWPIIAPTYLALTTMRNGISEEIGRPPGAPRLPPPPPKSLPFIILLGILVKEIRAIQKLKKEFLQQCDHNVITADGLSLLPARNATDAKIDYNDEWKHTGTMQMHDESTPNLTSSPVHDYSANDFH